MRPSRLADYDPLDPPDSWNIAGLKAAREAGATIADSYDLAGLAAARAAHDPSAGQLLDGWSGRGLRSIERDLAELRERRELLEEQLPTAEQVAEAERQAAGLVKQAAEQTKRFEDSWSAFMVALADAETAARQVVEARSEAQATIHELSRLVEKFGLANVEVQREFRPGTPDSKLAGLLGALLQSVGYAQVIERSLDAEVDSAKRSSRSGGGLSGLKRSGSAIAECRRDLAARLPC